MTISFELDGITDKQADDIAMEVIEYLRTVEQVMVTNYEVTG